MPNKKPSTHEGIVLSGGGIGFCTHVGILLEMSQWKDERGASWLERFKTRVGTSAGALYAAFWAAGYSPAQIALIAKLFGDPALGPSLFDVNWAGLGSALLEHDLVYFRGAYRGYALQSLYETILNRKFAEQFQKELSGLDLTRINAKERREQGARLVTAWHETRKKDRDRKFFDGLINFGDCSARGIRLYLLGVNLYNGQKLVFCQIPKGKKACDDLDLATYEYSKPNYINAPTKQETAKQQQDLLSRYNDQTIELNFRRYENRVYHDFDRKVYGDQFPLALALRASMSIPGIFDPYLVRRGRNENTHRWENDLMIDGGVDDNFSLSVAVDPNLGDCARVLGITLGNLGYRLPNLDAADGITHIMLKTADYFGTSIVDAGQWNKRLNESCITIISAVSEVSAGLADLTNTRKIPRLMGDGQKIARDFWRAIHPSRAFPLHATRIKPGTVFAHKRGQRVYLSPAARVGPKDFGRIKSIQDMLPEPTSRDIVMRLFALPRVPRYWLALYALLGWAVVGLIAFCLGIWDAVREGAFPALRWWVEIAAAIAAVFMLRIVAYRVWEHAEKKLPTDTMKAKSNGG